jgi:hypothetical protein
VTWVPDVVGLRLGDARYELGRRNISSLSADPDIPIFALPRDSVVIEQWPEPGQHGAVFHVRLAVDRGGSGVREPRRMGPPPQAAAGELDESTGERDRWK